MEYKVKAEWKSQFNCLEKDFPKMLKLSKIALTEYIYGNVQQLIHQLEVSLYEQDFDSIVEIIRKIKEEIYL